MLLSSSLTRWHSVAFLSQESEGILFRLDIGGSEPFKLDHSIDFLIQSPRPKTDSQVQANHVLDTMEGA